VNQVQKRVAAWKNLPAGKSSPRQAFQLEWEAEIIEYVNFVWQKTRPQSKRDEAKGLPQDVPLLGPCFIPPNYLHTRKRSGAVTISPETQYLKALNILHPFYYPELAQCPQCHSRDDVCWDGWTGTGARELHGIATEEAALGLQLRCNACKVKFKAAKKAGTHQDHGSDEEGLDSEVECLDSTGHGGDERVRRETSTLEGYCFALTSNVFWKGWKHWEIPRKLTWLISARKLQHLPTLGHVGGIPIFYRRCGLTRELFDLLVELRPSTTSAGLAEHVRRECIYLTRMSEAFH
jgi:hypothetical protein